MSEASLAAILRRERGELELALRGRDPHEALPTVRQFLDRLLEAYVADGQDDPGDRLRDALEAVRASVAATEAVRLVEPAPPAPPPRPEETRGGGGVLRAWLRAPRETVDAARDGWHGEEPPAPEPARARRPRLEVDAERLLDALEEALEAADRALEPAPEPVLEPPPPMEWSDDKQLVALLQDLLSAGLRGNATELLGRVSLLEQELALRHEITAVTFDGDNEEHFEFLPHPNPSETEAVTRRPALVAGERLVRRGEVRVPAQDMGRPQGRHEQWPELPTP